jgi:hypothetical protein
MDLENLEHNTRDGLHIASLAVRRHAGSRRRAELRPAPATATHPPSLRALLSRQAPEGRDRPRAGQLLTHTGSPAADHPPRPATPHHDRAARKPDDSRPSCGRRPATALRQAACYPSCGGLRAGPSLAAGALRSHSGRGCRLIVAA